MKIKFAVVLFLIPISLTGCTTTLREVEVKEVKPGDNISIFNYSDAIRIIKIGNCQYISWAGSHRERGYAHKGDCNNPMHIYNKIKK